MTLTSGDDLPLRERKKLRTREAIQREALRLITSQGYDATTCEQVAAAAGVSPATLFRHYPTKEDLVLHDVYDPMIAQAVRARPAEEDPLTAVRLALTQALGQVYERDLEANRVRTALVLSVPALRARSREQQDDLVALLAEALAARGHGPADGALAHVAATALAGALAVAVQRWADGGGSLPQHVSEAMVALEELVRPQRDDDPGGAT